jgi:hypothetical protein
MRENPWDGSLPEQFSVCLRLQQTVGLVVGEQGENEQGGVEGFGHE